MNSISTGSHFEDTLNAQMGSFTNDVPEREMSIEITISGDILLTVSFSNIWLSASFSISLMAEVSSQRALSDMDYVVSIDQEATKKYAEMDNLPILCGKVTEIGATDLPDGLLQIALRFNEVVYPFGAELQLQIQLSGTPKIILLGFALKNVPSPLLGKSASLSIPEHKGSILNQSISIRMPLYWPFDHCSDSFCNVAYNLWGVVNLDLNGTIANTQPFSLTATAGGDIELEGDDVILHFGVQLGTGTNPSVGVVGSIELHDPEIILAGAIRATASGVRLEGSMSGCWYVFESSKLTLCNLFLATTISPSPKLISGLEFGGRVEIGKQSHAEAYVGTNRLNPNENYFYADIGPATFQNFVDIFFHDIDLPKSLGDSGFPNGFTASFSALGTELPHAGLSIPPGVQFMGTFNFLGAEIFMDIHLQPPTKIKAKINLPPLTLANVFKMYQSSSDKSAGPYFDAEITVTQPSNIKASGFIEVIGISVESRFLKTSTKTELELTGTFLELCEAHLLISATYPVSITSGSFLVEGSFKNDLTDESTAVTDREGVEAANAVSNFASIKEVNYKLKLSVDYGIEFQFRAKGSVMGYNFDLNLEVNTKNPFELVKNVVSRTFNWISTPVKQILYVE